MVAAEPAWEAAGLGTPAMASAPLLQPWPKTAAAPRESAAVSFGTGPTAPRVATPPRAGTPPWLAEAERAVEETPRGLEPSADSSDEEHHESPGWGAPSQGDPSPKQVTPGARVAFASSERPPEEVSTSNAASRPLSTTATQEAWAEGMAAGGTPSAGAVFSPPKRPTDEVIVAHTAPRQLPASTQEPRAEGIAAGGAPGARPVFAASERPLEEVAVASVAPRPLQPGTQEARAEGIAHGGTPGTRAVFPSPERSADEGIAAHIVPAQEESLALPGATPDCEPSQASSDWESSLDGREWHGADKHPEASATRDPATGNLDLQSIIAQEAAAGLDLLAVEQPPPPTDEADDRSSSESY